MHNGNGNSNAFEIQVSQMSREAIESYRTGVNEPILRYFRIAAWLWEASETDRGETTAVLLDEVLEIARQQMDPRELTPLMEPELGEVWSDLIAVADPLRPSPIY